MRTYLAFPSYWLRFLAIFGVMLSGCGDVHLGSVNNDPAPNGTLLASGTFVNAQVSGDVLMYSTQNGAYVLRFVGYSGPSPTNITAVVTGNGTTVASIAMTMSSGTRNYGFSAASGITFNTVTIHSNVGNTDIAVATLH